MEKFAEGIFSTIAACAGYVTQKKSVLFIALLMIVVLEGCSSIRPVVPDNLMKPFQEVYRSKLTPDPTSAPLSNVRDAISSFNIDTLANLNKQNDTAWMYSDMTFYGVIGTVAGSVADKIGLRNTGAGAAALGSTIPNHYQVEPTFQAYLKAMKRTNCVASRVSEIPTDIESRFANIQSADTAGMNDVSDAIIGMRENIYGAMNTIQQELATTILTSRPTESSPSDFNAMLDKFKKAALTPGEKSAVLSPAAATQALRVKNMDITSAQEELRVARVKLMEITAARSKLELEASLAKSRLMEHEQQSRRRSLATLGGTGGGTEKAKEAAQLRDLQSKQSSANKALLEIQPLEDAAQTDVFNAEAKVAAAQHARDLTFVEAQEKANADIAAMEKIKGLSAALSTCISGQ